MEKRANQESEIGVHKYEGFTMMQNHHLRNKGLSLKAVGLLSKILSLPPDWDYSLRGLATLNTDGIDGVRSAMKGYHNVKIISHFHLPRFVRCTAWV